MGVGAGIGILYSSTSVLRGMLNGMNGEGLSE